MPQTGLNRKALKLNRLSGSVAAPVARSTLNDRVRERLKEEKAKLGLSEQDIASWLQWSKPKVAQKLGGRTDITLDELESLCFAVDLMPSEVVRDRGMEFSAEMAPHELRVLERLRKLDQPTRDAFLHMLDVKMKEHTPDRYATDFKKIAKARLKK